MLDGDLLYGFTQGVKTTVPDMESDISCPLLCYHVTTR